MPDLLTTAGLCKSYAAPVLTDIDFALRPGEVHALVGENGAGKSTLGRILSGRVRPDAGRMTLNDAPYAPTSPRDAERRGVCMVMQELNLIGTLSVAENIFLNRLPRRFGWIDYRRLHRDAAAIMAQVGLGGIDPAQPVGSLGVGQQQLVEIAAGTSRDCRVLILDEPTAALTDAETELLFAQIARLQAAGVGIIYVSHRMEEIQRLADRITVLRDGKLVATHEAKAVTIDAIVQQMVGRELGAVFRQEQRPRGAEALRVAGLARGDVVRGVSFTAYRGEILGVAGLMGAGRTETLRLIFGADRADAGQVFLHGAATPARLHSPRDAVRQGIALVTEDRKAEGVLLPLPIRVNITLARLRAQALGGWIRPGGERAAADRCIAALGVRCRSPEQPVGQLSGGNQQKVVLAKWLYRDPDVLLCDEPTRGIDIGARFEIYQLLDDLAARGKAIVLVSSDLRELLSVCDRIVVLSAGKVAATFERGQWSQDLIMKAALP